MGMNAAPNALQTESSLVFSKIRAIMVHIELFTPVELT